jgi:glutathione S-transferase
MIKIYGTKQSRATRVIWAALELGLPHELVIVDRVAGDHKKPDFLKINPNGRIPALEDDGLVMFESLAMTLYLAKKAGGPLAPKDLKEDALMTMWTLWGVNEVEPHSVQVLYHRMLWPEDQRDEQKALASIETLRAPLAVLEAHLAQHDYVVGDRFTIADINVAAVCSYARLAPELIKTLPHVEAYLNRILERPHQLASRKA